ncbi:MAG: phosphoribosyl-AMP cyclohydrolase [Euryarchaeota archaeon]|nr:phosphoribosyl-AMP cyclohydrolase [Euryarchaeota archaeon]
MDEILSKVNFRIRLAGEELAIAVVQEHRTKEVLMVAFMNREALAETLRSRRMTYYSTSRRKLWVKGETSGNYQLLKEARLDCDGDALLFEVEQVGVACHTGRRSCFYRRISEGE